MRKILLSLLLTLLTLALGAALFITVRQARAAASAELAWQSTTVTPLGDFGSVRRLEILPLYEEAGDPARFRTGHGLAYLIRLDDTAVLLDVGDHPDPAVASPLQYNLQALGLDWDAVDAVLFSHFHPDHVGGTAAWRAGRVGDVAAPGELAGKPVYLPSRFEAPGGEPRLLADPTVLGEGLATLGAIEFGERLPMSLFTASGAEQVLAVSVAGEGIVLVMGCGHPGLEKVLARAEALFDQPVVGIVGGLHYEGLSAAQVQPQIERLQALDLRLLAPSPHDSSPEALQALRLALPDAYRDVRVGEAISLP